MAQAQPLDQDPEGAGPGETVGEYVTVDLEDDEFHTVDDGDGGQIVTIGDYYEPRDIDDDDFYQNLAEVLSPSVLGRISGKLWEKVDSDKEARKKKDESQEEGIKRTGLGKDAPGGAPFEGASKVVHPMMVEACVDYEARVIKELYAPAGPVKQRIIGEPTRQKSDRGKRKVEHMNWQLTVQMPEARPVFETMFTQVPLGGSQYIHLRWDHKLGRPKIEFVPCDRTYFPYNCADWHSSHRRTISWTVPRIEFDERVEQGLYRELDLGTPAQYPDQSKSQKATEKVAGKDEPATNLDGDREITETMELMEVTADMVDELQGPEQEGEIRPYLISMDWETRQIVGMYRDWEPDDETCQPIEHTFEFPFIYWRDGNVGFPHLIGGLSAAATGSLRALLDSAHVQNAQTGALLKGSGVSGQTKQPKIGELLEIESGIEADDIRKKLMMFNNPGPSPVLFQLLGFLVDAGRGVVRTSLDELATDQQPNTPVGTTMARVEEGMVVFSAVFGRVHTAFDRFLMGLHRLNRLYLPRKLAVDNNGQEILVYRRDYEGPVDVQPTANPTVYSDQQRFQQIIAIQGRAAVLPQVYKVRRVEEKFLELLKVQDPDEYLQDIPEPHELNAVNENLSLMMGRPVKAFPEQDHESHLVVLLDFIEAFGMNPILAPKFLPGAIQHALEHIGYLYVAKTDELVSTVAGQDSHLLMSADPQVKKRFDKLLAKSSQFVIPHMTQLLARATQLLMRAQQMMAQYAPKPPMDPGAAAVQASLAETQRKTTADQQSHQIDQGKLQIAAVEAQTAKEKAQLDSATKIATTSADNQTAEDIAAMRINRGQAPGFSTGESMKGD